MRKFTVILVLGFLSICSVTSGEIITIGIEGVVDSVDDSGNLLEGNVTVGSTITGWYKYDTATLDDSPFTTVGDYRHYNTPAGMYLTVGGLEFQTDPANVDFLVEIVNDHPSGYVDGYLVRSSNNLPLLNGVGVDSIRWQLDDYSGSVLSNTIIPSTAPILSNWPDGNMLRIHMDRGYLIRGHATNAYVIPEPATVLLFGLGIVFLRKRK